MLRSSFWALGSLDGFIIDMVFPFAILKTDKEKAHWENHFEKDLRGDRLSFPRATACNRESLCDIAGAAETFPSKGNPI